MKKKKVLLLVSIASVALLSATAAVVFSGQANAARLSAGEEVNHYEIEFTKDDFFGFFDETEGYENYYYMECSKEKGIGGLYDIASELDETYAYAEAQENFSFSDYDDAVFTISGASYWGISIGFGIIGRAYPILADSYLKVEINGVYQSAKVFNSTGSYEGKNYYTAYLDNHNENETVKLLGAVFVFECAK